MCPTFAPLATWTRETAGFAPLWSGNTPCSTAADALEAEREAILAAAREEAANLLQEAREQAAAMLAEVRAAREHEQAAFRRAAESVLAALRQDWQRHLGQLERETVHLVSAILRRLLRDHFSADPDRIVPVVREALQRLSDSQRVQVVVAPAHEPAIRRAQEELAALLSAEAQLEVRVDEALTSGDCLVHGERGSLDARLETRLELVNEAIDSALSRRTASGECGKRGHAGVEHS